MNTYNTTSFTPSILIVDDTRANLRLLAGMLAEHGYRARPVPNGALALSAARAEPPDLILLDINMPNMNGYEVCRRLKADEQTSHIPIIFISALDDTSHKVKAFTVGGVDYITKPFQIEEVIARVETHLALRKLQKQLEQANEELERRVKARTAELAQLNVCYERFVPREFLAFLQKKSILEVELGDQVQQELTVMFADIRGFTTLSEQLSPQVTFHFINEYLSWVSPVIRQHEGFIDKYIGDAIMALFPYQAEHALQAAIAMLKQLSGYNIYRQTQSQPPINIGIGLHTGSLMLGIIGEQERMQGTVISDAVNVAERLEKLTKEYGASLIISQQTLRRLPNPSAYQLRFLDRVQVKGKQKPVLIFEVFDGDAPAIRKLKSETKLIFEEGMRLYYKKKFSLASVNFSEILKINPNDKAARLHLKRAAHYMVRGVPAGWNGVEVFI